MIMADPPWDIHMDLPYGTMEDEEMRRLPIASLQDDGYIFLWVTGRAMELGRQCLKVGVGLFFENPPLSPDRLCLLMTSCGATSGATSSSGSRPTSCTSSFARVAPVIG